MTRRCRQGTVEPAASTARRHESIRVKSPPAISRTFIVLPSTHLELDILELAHLRQVALPFRYNTIRHFKRICHPSRIAQIRLGILVPFGFGVVYRLVEFLIRAIDDFCPLPVFVFTPANDCLFFRLHLAIRLILRVRLQHPLTRRRLV